jgi:hypothetical protein
VGVGLEHVSSQLKYHGRNGSADLTQADFSTQKTIILQNKIRNDIHRVSDCVGVCIKQMPPSKSAPRLILICKTMRVCAGYDAPNSAPAAQSALAPVLPHRQGRALDAAQSARQFGQAVGKSLRINPSSCAASTKAPRYHARHWQ